MKTLLSLFCGLLLFACNNTTTTVAPVTTDPQPPMEATTPGSTLNATLDAVSAYNGDVTALPGAAAVSNINTWIDQLEDIDAADKVTWNLRALKNTLSQPTINGQLAGMQLISLAEDTRQVGGTSSGITALASALKAGGEKLTNSAFGGSDLLGQTLSVIKSKGADITTLPGSAAVGNIDSWITKLEAMDGTTMITSDLKQLKMELGKSSIDGAKVGTLLNSLARNTRALGGDNAGLATLAYALEAGASRLMYSK